MNFLDILVSPIIEVTKCLFAPIGQQIVYVRDLKENFEKLEEKARDLTIKKDSVNDEIRRHGTDKKPERECEHWLSKVEEIEKEVNDIKEKNDIEDRRCSRGWFLNIQSQWKLGKRVVVTVNRISDLIKESDSAKQAMVDAPPQVVERMPAPTINDETSTARTLCKILECVKDPKRHKIGIWGMGGVGKTTVMSALNNHTNVEEIFEVVIWVTVSRDCSMTKVQNEIAIRLNLLEDKSDESLTRKLYKHLKTKKFLLLMDDVWNKVDLDNVGVPCPNQNGGKVVFTTRSRKVCNQMETDGEIKVEPLPSEEAWKLFREKAGDVVDHPEIHEVAKSVVAECAGLPLAIAVVGASLRKEEDINVWKNAQRELSYPATSNVEEMEEQVFKRLKFSFDRLKDGNLKNCFLYAALYPEDDEIDIDEIIDYWMVEGLIGSSLNLVQMRCKGHAILKELIDGSLLERTSPKRPLFKIHVLKMHDVIRDLALKITSPEREGHKFFVRAGARIDEHLDSKQWEQVERISLRRSKLKELPERPYCPALLTLLLFETKELTRIPESFFDHMHSLKVLDLSWTRIESLPPSICNLVHLRGLYLKCCYELKTLPPETGALTSLEVLDVSNCLKIEKIPSEIGELAHLRVLKCPSKVMIAGGTIARLSQLEQFSTIEEFQPYCMGVYDSSKCAVAVIEDVCHLEKLMCLHFCFANIKYLECFIERSSRWMEVRDKSFNFTVGSCPVSSYPGIRDKRNKILSFCGGMSIPNATEEVLGYANYFALVSHKSVHKLCQFSIANMNNLRECLIVDCIKMETVLDGASISNVALPNLETLQIYLLHNLQSIWADPLPLGSLACLRELSVSYCYKLTKIFHRKTIQQLSNLEELIVQHCSSLEEVISEEEPGMMFECKLPKLRKLVVSNLPALVSVSKDCSLTCPSFEAIIVCNCPRLRRLPQGICESSNLKMIACNGEWWDELQWDDIAVKIQLEAYVSRQHQKGEKLIWFALD